ncbi:hypothetical protein ACFRAR_22520 [Kitasatospora sp. NPDC056651]|uniref:hypothetical protein n=1 Tax=Kitasatospora sp. NPDC056651 TaxID=3345892 RepID=UPI003686835F
MRHSRSVVVFCCGVALAAVGSVFELVFERGDGTSAFEVSVPLLIAAWFLERRRR